MLLPSHRCCRPAPRRRRDVVGRVRPSMIICAVTPGLRPGTRNSTSSARSRGCRRRTDPSAADMSAGSVGFATNHCDARRLKVLTDPECQCRHFQPPLRRCTNGPAPRSSLSTGPSVGIMCDRRNPARRDRSHRHPRARNGETPSPKLHRMPPEWHHVDPERRIIAREVVEPAGSPRRRRPSSTDEFERLDRLAYWLFEVIETRRHRYRPSCCHLGVASSKNL